MRNVPPLFVKLIALVFLTIVLVQCRATIPSETETSASTQSTNTPTFAKVTTTPEATAVEATATVMEEETTKTPTTTEPAPTTPPTSTIDETEVFLLTQSLAVGDRDAATQAIDTIVEANDVRFTAVFIELIRAGQLGIVRNAAQADYVNALDALTGENFGSDWASWVEWYGNTDLTPPPGFTTWKGIVLSRIDPFFGVFLDDAHPSRIRVEEIQWGGVVVDGIPALVNPAMLAAEEADYLNAEDPVFGLQINDEARAYPLRILDWHEMANDVIGGVPVSLAYCTLCGAAVAYDGRATNGQTYTFGSSGFLFRSNKLMYDKQTFTLWNQLTGEPVLGELADSDVTLDILPVVLTSWADWQAKHPNTLVVDENTGYDRNYAPGAAYGNYFASSSTMFPVAQRSDLLETKDQIYALRIDGVPKAYPLTILTEEVVINDTVVDTNVVLVAPRGTISVAGDNQYIGEVAYTAGGEVRAYERGDYTFAMTDDPDWIIDEAGETWQVSEAALIGPNGETLERLGGHLAYWFGWFAFFPNTLVYGN